MKKNSVGGSNAADDAALKRKAMESARGARERFERNAQLANLGQLVFSVAHELRSPLGAMLTSLHLVDSRVGAVDPVAKKGLDRIRRSVRRCDDIITRLLDYSRYEPLALEETGIDQWLQALFHTQSLPEGVTLSFRPGLGDGRFEIDRDQMWRVIVHIIENAAQAIGDGGKPGHIAVSTRAGGASLEIHIADNGPGVPEECRADIFEPLFSVRQAGIGLGLPIAKRIVEQHGGTIALDSPPGQGTSVTVTLPLDPERPAGD